MYSFTKPEDNNYVDGSLEVKTFSCSNENAPMYKEACLPEYTGPKEGSNETGVK